MFSRLIGNEEVKESLRRALETNRLASSLLFTGDEGIGKKLFALEVAKALNCRNRRGLEACDECPSCKRISRSTFPPFGRDDDDKNRIIWSEHGDIAMVRPYKQIIRVGPIRELEREANFRPFEGAARIFIIEDAEYMNLPAANSLLKTLEEPEPASHLILTTTNSTALPATIRSRCQVVQFAPIPLSEIEQFLTTNHEMPHSDAALLARVSRGSIGRALATDVETYRERRDAMLSVLRTITIDNDGARLLRLAEGLSSNTDREEYEQHLDVLESLIRDAWGLQLGRPNETIINHDLISQLREIADESRSKQAQSWLTQIEELRGALEVNVNRRIATDGLFLSLTATASS
jgi:DNA polymerase-3 subunit delta'